MTLNGIGVERPPKNKGADMIDKIKYAPCVLPPIYFF